MAAIGLSGVRGFGTYATAGGTAQSAQVTLTTTAGRGLRAVVVSQEHGTHTVSDNRGNTWVKVGSDIAVAQDIYSVTLSEWFCASNLTGGAGHVITGTGPTGCAPSIQVEEFDGPAAVDATSNTTETGASPYDASVTAVAAETRIMAAIMPWVSTGWAVTASGYTTRGSYGDPAAVWPIGALDKARSSAGADAASFVVTGNVGGTNVPIRMTAYKAAGGTNPEANFDPAGYTVAAPAVGLLYGRVAGFAPAVYTVNAPAVTLRVRRRASFDPTAYAVAAPAVGLLYGRQMKADPVTYGVTAAPVTLTVVPGGHVPFPVDPVAYGVTAAPVGLLYGRVAGFAPAAYAVAAPAVALRRRLRTGFAPVTYGVTGAPVTLTVRKRLTVDPAGYAVSAPAVTLRVRRRMNWAAVGYVVTAAPVRLDKRGALEPTQWVYTAIGAEVRSYAVPGENRGYAVPAEARTWSITP